MDKMKAVGCVIFIALAIGGVIFFQDFKKKADAKAESEAGAYFLSLMAEDQTTDLNAGTGKPPSHPWIITGSPTQLELEDKVKLPRTTDGTWFTFDIHYDPAGGANPPLIHQRVKFDQTGHLDGMSGIHGTLGRFAQDWSPTPN